MKQQILKTIELSIIIGLCLGVASAFDYNLTAGGSVTIPIGFHIINCSIENNNSNLDGLNISWYGKNVTISTVFNYKPDTFTLSCGVIKFGEVVEEEIIPSSGGWRCAYDKDFDWDCSEWSDCIDGAQTRTCKKYNNCQNTYGRPVVVQKCTLDVEIDEHGCNLTEGYTWCEPKQKCLNPKEEACIEDVDEEKPNKIYLYIILSFLSLIVIILIV